MECIARYVRHPFGEPSALRLPYWLLTTVDKYNVLASNGGELSAYGLGENKWQLFVRKISWLPENLYSVRNKVDHGLNVFGADFHRLRPARRLCNWALNIAPHTPPPSSILHALNIPC